MRKLKLLLMAALMLPFHFLWAQTHEISGRITDDKGNPLYGVTVHVNGTKVTTTTRQDGSFKLEASPNSVLALSIIGFETKEINVGSQTNLNSIPLVQDTKLMSEVVVTGTGVATSKQKLGFAVESIKGDKLPQTPIASIDQALVGKIAGAQISSVSGNPGDEVNIVLRGINSVQGGTRPMILLDGVEIPFANLSTLDLTQVERVEVVQGAASSALYGAQGANGVIQIFSKKGVKGRMSINVSSSYSHSSYINAGDFHKANLHPYLTDANGNLLAHPAGGGFNDGDPLQIDPDLGYVLGNMAYRYGKENGGTAPGQGTSYSRYGILDPRNSVDQPYKGNFKYYDHFKQVFQSAPSYNNSISIGGGGDKVDYNFAMANNRTYSALLKDNGYVDRTNLTANLGMELFKNFTIRSITNLAYTFSNLHPTLGAPGGANYGYGNSNANVSAVYGFLNTPAFQDLQGTITGGVPAAGYFVSDINIAANAFNPFYTLYYSKGDSKKYDIIQSFDANYKVNRFLSLDGKYGISYKNENDIWTFYNQTLNANSNDQATWASWYNTTDNTGEYDNFQYAQTKQNLFASATLRFDFQKDFNFKLPIQSTTLAGYDYRKNTYKEVDFYGYSLPIPPPYSFGSTQSQSLANQYNETFVTYGYLVDQKFDYGNYGGITAGFRTDYSSAFGAGSKPFTFPHFNGYLNLPSFLGNSFTNVFPSFKLRASYGKAGIQPGAYQRQPVLVLKQTADQVTYTNTTGAANPDLGVEVSSETEYGTDFSVNTNKNGSWFKNLNFSFTYWKRHTDGAIISVNLAPSVGYTNITNNAITMSSNGWQLAVNIPIVTTKDWSWDFTSNFGHQTSMINSIVGGDIPVTPATQVSGAGNVVLKAGDKIGQLYGYKVLTSVDQLRADGKTPFIDPANQGNYEVVNGMVVNKQTKALFISDEASAFGDPNPTLTSSFITSVAYKGFITFGLQFDWIQGSHLYNATDEWMYREGISGDWTKPVTINGETGAWTAYYASAYYALGNTARGVGNDATKDYFYKDASFWRLRNISLGFDFSRFIKQAWLKKCQLVLSGRNLLTFTKYGGLDPEINSGGSNSAWDRGNDHSTIPNLKAYQATLNLGF